MDINKDVFTFCQMFDYSPEEYGGMNVYVVWLIEFRERRHRIGQPLNSSTTIERYFSRTRRPQ